MPQIPFEQHIPHLGQRAYLAPDASVIGDVTLGDDSSVWPQAVIRGDMHAIRIGARSNVQDGAVLHVTHASDYNPGGFPVSVGDEVIIGHKAVLHGCSIGNNVLVGIGAIIMDGAIVDDEVMIAAGTLVGPGKHLASGYLYVGSPARQARALTEQERQFLHYSPANYVRLKDRYLAQDSA